MRVLLSAYACEPDSGSEPGVGWAWAEMLTTFADVTVLTRSNNREAIEASARDCDWVERIEWVYHDLPLPVQQLKLLTGAVQFYYVLWQYAAIPVVQRIIAAQKVDVFHHLTFGSYWMPSATGWIDVPSIYGPVGGAESPPLGFAADRTRSLIFEAVRSLARRVLELDPSVRRAARRSTVAIAKAPETATRLRVLGARDVRTRTEVVHSSVGTGVPSRSVGELQLISVGRLHHLKGYQLALDALAEARGVLPAFRYTIIGEGPHRRFLQNRIERLGLGEVVALAGSLPRADVLGRLVAADVFIHPSLHDSGGWACVEAMSAALPVICLNIGGPATQVDSSCGVIVDATTRDQAVSDIADAIVQLARSSSVRASMGSAGLKRVAENFSRDAQLRWLESVYHDVGLETPTG